MNDIYANHHSINTLIAASNIARHIHLEEKPGLFTATTPKLTGPWSEPAEDDYVDFEGNKKCKGVKAL